MSFDGLSTSLKRAQPAALPASWPRRAGTPWGGMPLLAGQDATHLERGFTRWLDAHAFHRRNQNGGR